MLSASGHQSRLACPRLLVNGHLPALLSSVFASMFFSVVVRLFLLPIQISSILEKWLPANESSPLARGCPRRLRIAIISRVFELMRNQVGIYTNLSRRLNGKRRAPARWARPGPSSVV